LFNDALIPDVESALEHEQVRRQELILRGIQTVANKRKIKRKLNSDVPNIYFLALLIETME
jgi:hypothetical protein